jgi:hypothetical protein
MGRQKHDILALGYMLDLLRRFAGPRSPPRVQVIGPPVMDRTAVEEVLSCEVSRGKASAIIFRSELLELPNVCPAIADYASASHNWGKPRLPATRDSFASKTIRVW